MMGNMPEVKIRNGKAYIEIKDSEIIDMILSGFGKDYVNMVSARRVETGYEITININPIIDKINNSFRVDSGENINLVTTSNGTIDLKINIEAIKKIISKMFKNANVIDNGDGFVIEIDMPNPVMPAMFSPQNFNLPQK